MREVIPTTTRLPFIDWMKCVLSRSFSRGPWQATSLLQNALANWLQLASGIASTLIITPIVVRSLGATDYGIWSFLNGLTTYADLFYLGLGGALVRFASEYRTRHDIAALQRLSSIVFTAYCVIGLMLLGLWVVGSPFAPQLFASELDPASAEDAMLSCVLIGIRLAALFGGSVFTGLLVAFERNDVSKAVMIGFTWLRVALIPWCVSGDNALVALAALSAATGCLETFTLAAFARAVTGGLEIRLVKPRIADLRPLYAFGALSFLIQLSSKLIAYTDITVIGMTIGAPAVAFYSLPLQLIEYGRYAISAIVLVLLPRLVAIHADGDSKLLGDMFVRVARLALFIGAFISVNFVLLGGSFLTRWIGPEFGGGDAFWILLWLGLASCAQILYSQVPLPFYQSLNRLSFPVTVMMLEASVNLVLSILLAVRYGSTGVAFASFVASAAISLIWIPRHLCRVLALRVRPTFAAVLFPALIVTLASGGLLLTLNAWWADVSYTLLVLKASGAVLVAIVVFFVTFPSTDRNLVRGVAQRVASVVFRLRRGSYEFSGGTIK